jgi:hypothetical protein
MYLSWVFGGGSYSYTCDHAKAHLKMGGPYGCDDRKGMAFPCDLQPPVKCKNYRDKKECPRRRRGGCVDVEDDDLS